MLAAVLAAWVAGSGPASGSGLPAAVPQGSGVRAWCETPCLRVEAETEPGWTEGLEAELEALIEELKRLEKEGREKLEQDVIPRVKQEIERLRELLEEFRGDGEEPPEPRSI